jgi:ATP-dependent RNA helicase DDX55/SPB4
MKLVTPSPPPKPSDRLLDLGFEKQLVSIISMLPKQRRTSLFSATMNEGLSRLVKAGLRNPVRVQVKVETNDGIRITEQSIPSSLQVAYMILEPEEKLAQLVHLIQNSTLAQKIIIYFSNGACVDYFFKLIPLLCNEGIAKASRPTFYSLHGKMVPKRREATYTSFSTLASTSTQVLLCTDVAARGLDLPDVDCVVQWDPPQDPKAFSHRCGRSGRAGRQGQALVFLHPNEDTYCEFLKVRKIPIDKMDKVQGVKVKSIMKKAAEFVRQDRDLWEKVGRG